MYIIPLLRIQGYYVNVCRSKHILKIEKMHREYRNSIETGDSCYMRINYELERQWYPVILTDNRWFAEAVLAYYATIKVGR